MKIRLFHVGVKRERSKIRGNKKKHVHFSLQTFCWDLLVEHLHLHSVFQTIKDF